jgi:photosystem II stability/assembly factor-like uncharacterized protein
MSAEQLDPPAFVSADGRVVVEKGYGPEVVVSTDGGETWSELAPEEALSMAALTARHALRARGRPASR